MLQAFEAYAEHGEMNLKFHKCRERFAQVRLHPGMAGYVRDFVGAAGNRSDVLTVGGNRGRLQFFKRFDGADDRPVLVVHGDGAYANRNFMARFVVKKALGLGAV